MVKVTAERIPESQVRLSIEVEPERIERSVEKAYRQLVGKINVPGFRRGKAPRHVVERMVGRETLFQQGLEDLVSEVYREAVRDLDLHPVAQPEVDLEPHADELKPGETLVVKATVPVEPTVESGDYRGIRLPWVDVQVTPDQINQIVDRIQEQQTTWEPVERPVQEGDRVTMDVHGEVGSYAKLYSPTGEPLLQSSGGQTITDEKGVEFDVDKESTQFPKGFVDQLIGMNQGQEKQFELSLPADYPDANLASKLALYKVTVHSIKEKHVPPIDDELAKSVGYESFDQMRADVEKQAQSAAEARAREVYETGVVNEAIARSQFEVPPALVNHEMEHLVENARDSLKRQRLDLDEYLRLTRKSEAELREDFREPAVRNVKVSLLLDRIAEQEGLEATPEEIDREIEAMALVMGGQADRFRQAFSAPEQRDRIANRIRNHKVVEFLVETAKSAPPEGAEAASAEPNQPTEPTEAEAKETEPTGSAQSEEAQPPAAESAGESAKPAGAEAGGGTETVEAGTGTSEQDRE